MGDVVRPGPRTGVSALTPEHTTVTPPHRRVDGASTSAVRADLNAAVVRGTGDVVVDLTGVEWVDAAGLAMLVAVHRRLRRQRRRLVLRGCHPAVRRALALTRLNRILELEPSLGSL